MLATLIPIVTLILVGVLIKKINYLSDEQISGLKNLASNVFLPVVVFNALATAVFTKDSVYIMAVSMFVLITGFLAGFVVKKLYKKDYKDFIPFMTVTFEGGMLGYALAQSLLGKENLKYIATIDLSGAIFSFTVWIVMLEAVSRRYSEDMEDKPKKSLLVTLLTTPNLVAAVLGLVFGISGLGSMLVESNISEIYTAIVDVFSNALTPVILISLGYCICITRENVTDAIIFIVQRFAVIGVSLAIALLLFGRFIDFTPELRASMILYFCLPPSLLLSVYVKGEKGQGVMACIHSIYIIITLVVFSVLLNIYK